MFGENAELCGGTFSAKEGKEVKLCTLSEKEKENKS
jgi:hypothetical protein